MTSGSLDTRPLSVQASRADVVQTMKDAAEGVYGEDAARAARTDRSADSCLAWLVSGLIGAGLLGFLALTRDPDHVPVVAALLAADVVLWVVLYVLGRAAARRRWAHHARVVAFARANGLGVQPVGAPAEPPSTILEFGRSGRTTDRVTWTHTGGARRVQVETATYSGTQRGRAAQQCRYLVVGLGLRSPDAALVPRGVDREYRLAVPPKASTVRDGVEVFGTVRKVEPLVATLVPFLAAEPMLAAEIVDGSLVVYAPGQTDVLDAALWERFVEIVDAVTAV